MYECKKEGVVKVQGLVDESGCSGVKKLRGGESRV